MPEAGAPTPAPALPTAAETERQRRSLARTVALFATAFLFAPVCLVISIAALIKVEKIGLSAVWGLVALLPLNYVVYRLISWWDPALGRLGWLARWFKPLADLLARKEEIETVVEGMEHVVASYSLGDLFAVGQVCPGRPGSLGFCPGFRKELVDTILVGVPSASWTKALIDQLKRRNSGWNGGEPKLLTLFYQESLGQVDPAFWRRIVRGRPNTLELVAQRLLTSERLPLSKEYPFQAADLVTVLAGMEHFELGLLQRRVQRLNALAGRASDYLVFLEENGVGSVLGPLAMGFFLGILGRTKGADGFDPACFEVDAAVLTEIGRRSMPPTITGQVAATASPAAMNALQNRYALLAAVIFLARSFPRDPAKALLCQELAKDGEAVKIAWAYLDLKQDLRSEHRLGGRPFLSLAHLIEHWPGKVESAEGNAEIGKEIEELTDVLRGGEWLVHLSDLVDRAQSTRLALLLAPAPAAQPTAQPPREKLAGRALIELGFDHRPDLLLRLFRGLDFETIERNLEARRFTPYLITFDTEHGPLAKLITCLTSEKKLEEAGVVPVQVEGRAKYNFRPYTENTRIGLVPPGWTFEKFRIEFQQDLARLIEHRKELVKHDWTKDLSGVEVMLHRFEAVGRNHYPFVSPFSTRMALQNIKDLLADNLAPEELLTLVQYGSGEELRARILASTIPDVVGNAVLLKPVERTALEKADGPLKSELLNRRDVHASTIPELAKQLAGRKIPHATAEDTLSDIIQKHLPRFTQPRSALIAKAYLEGIESLSAA